MFVLVYVTITLFCVAVVAYAAFGRTKHPWQITAVGAVFAITLPWMCWVIAFAIYFIDGYRKPSSEG
ncbi:MAG: hypothetical protein GJ680_09655 [Alteromonadaceae bacterium]|nr:hypothetical protein [Alteromonadaceae bacterium]